MRIIKNNKKRVIIYIVFLLVILFLTFILVNVIKRYYFDWNFNKCIINEKSQVVRIQNVKSFNLWNKTIENLQDNKKNIDLDYENYAIKLDTNKLKNKNELITDVSVKKTTTEHWKDKESVEIDLSELKEINIIDQIRIDVQELLSNYKRVDVYGINLNTGKSEYIETKEIEEDEITIIASNQYKRYLLVYIPIEKIEIESDEIVILKNETYPLKISVFPKEATYKNIHIEEGENDIIKINQDCTIQAISPGNQDIEIQAEDGKITKKIKIIVKEIAEGIEVEESNISINEGESKKIKAKIIPDSVENKKLIYLSENPEIATVNEEGIVNAIKEGKTQISIKTEAEPVQERKIDVDIKKKQIEENSMVSVVTSQDNNQSSLIANNYINGVLLVNKQYRLPSNYNPGINKEALNAFEKMKNEASKSGISLKIVSGYRSYKTQQAIYNKNVDLYGDEIANSFSAKPRRV